jgi:5-methylcytosine-specific restriction endonuclease McrA
LAEENLTKHCSLCHWQLPLDCFHKYRDGLRPECKDCRKLATRADYLKRKDKITASNELYYLANKEKLDRSRKDWRKRNRERLLKTKRAYGQRPDVSARNLERNRRERQANPERSIEYSRRWREKHPEINRASHKANKIKRRNVPGTCTPSQWIAKCEYFGWRCYLCRVALTTKTTHMEHRKPLARGGTHWPANLAPACKKCNLSKNNKTEKEYRLLLDGLEQITSLIASSPCRD